MQALCLPARAFQWSNLLLCFVPGVRHGHLLWRTAQPNGPMTALLTLTSGPVTQSEIWGPLRAPNQLPGRSCLFQGRDMHHFTSKACLLLQSLRCKSELSRHCPLVLTSQGAGYHGQDHACHQEQLLRQVWHLGSHTEVSYMFSSLLLQRRLRRAACTRAQRCLYRGAPRLPAAISNKSSKRVLLGRGSLMLWRGLARSYGLVIDDV